MLLEINIYDNISPNKYLKVPDDENKLPSPKIRSTILDYELFETGYEYTSSGIIASSNVAVGDVVEVLYQGEYTGYYSIGNPMSFKKSFWYVITELDENNKATMQNYYWYNIEGNEIPNFGNLFNNAYDAIMTGKQKASGQVMYWDTIISLEYFNPISLKQNIKGDTVPISQVVKEAFRKTQIQPLTVRDNGYSSGKEVLSQMILPITLPRQRVATKIDLAQNPAMEEVIVTTRSNYNTLRFHYKNVDGNWITQPRVYTLDKNNNIVRLDNISGWTGDPNDLPHSRSVKTTFYDELPTDSVIRSEITGDTTTKKIYFNQNPKRPLRINDLVGLWWEGTYYEGSIVDIVHTESVERCTFIQGEGI